MSDLWLAITALALWFGTAVIIALAYHTVKVLYQRRQARQQARRRP